MRPRVELSRRHPTFTRYACAVYALHRRRLEFVVAARGSDTGLRAAHGVRRVFGVPVCIGEFTRITHRKPRR